MDATQRFLNACRRQPVDRPPVWIMRQAGRYMPSYRKVREKVSFLELCRTPELACEVTLQPIDQLGVDAAILFSDILVPLEPMGLDVDFTPGPVIANPVRTHADVESLRVDGAAEEIGYVYEAVRQIKRALGGRVPLLGFAGAPFTLASYAIEGGTSRNHHEIKRLMYAEPETLDRVLTKITDVIIDYLRRQISAGVDAVQLFDTWGGILTNAQWQRFSRRYTARILEALKDTGVPTIHYIKDGAHLLADLGALPCDVLSVDWRMPLGQVREATGGRHALQGNIDPAVLTAGPEVIAAAVRANFESYGNEPGHIVNLGHGITPDVTVEAAKTLVAEVQEQGLAYGG
jgi:uroporphyrinogen decarboxylase